MHATEADVEKIITALVRNTQEDIDVSTADPLGCDDFLCKHLPALNRKKDSTGILQAAEKFSRKAIELENLSRTESLAVERDLGFIAASLVRHGAPLPGMLAKALVLYGGIIDEAPRDTVFSYGPRNPPSPRRRKFTELPAEDVFISSFVAGMAQNLDCLTGIVRALALPVGSDEFFENISKSAAAFSAMVDAMIVVRKEVPPEIFTFELRPYFDPIELNGKKYFAPGGAQMPVILIDMCLWGKSSTNHFYREYFAENLSYAPHYYRKFPQAIASLPSMLEKIDIYQRKTPTDAEKKSLVAVQELLTSLVRFRHVHLAVARANFALRNASDVGSGGYKVDILDRLLEETTNMRNLVKGLTMKGFFNMKNDFSPYAVGSVFNPAIVSKPAHLSAKSLKIEYPTRLNAMAIDPSGITSNKNMVYTPGEVVLAIDLPRYITLKITPVAGEILIHGSGIRKSLVRHAVKIMQKALEVDHGIEITIDSPHEIRHAGLGSSSGTIASVCAAINELYGQPIDNAELIRYTAQNHGEEIDGDEEMLMPVQCIGGAAAAGLHTGGVMILTGESAVIASTALERDIVIGIPEDYIPLDSKTLMEKEIENLDKFMKTGEKHRHDIAYAMLHHALPAMSRGDVRPLGNLVFDYRFNMGSIDNCSFVYPHMVDIAKNIRNLHEQGKADILALSSVGPAFFALTSHVDDCKKTFEQNGMKCTVTKLYNSPYRVMEKTV